MPYPDSGDGGVDDGRGNGAAPLLETEGVLEDVAEEVVAARAQEGDRLRRQRLTQTQGGKGQGPTEEDKAVGGFRMRKQQLLPEKEWGPPSRRQAVTSLSSQ